MGSAAGSVPRVRPVTGVLLGVLFGEGALGMDRLAMTAAGLGVGDRSCVTQLTGPAHQTLSGCIRDRVVTDMVLGIGLCAHPISMVRLTRA